MKRQLLALAAAFVASTSALAAPVTLHNFQYGYEVLHSAQFGTLYTGALMGEYNGGARNSFVTYCNDLYQHVSWNVNYTDYSLVATGARPGLTVAEAAMLGRLYTTAGAVDTHDETVAFQLAVWELTHDATPGDIRSGSFSIDGGGTATQLSLAQTWLNAATSSGTASNYVVSRLYSPTAQDFLVASHVNFNQTDGHLPEPTGLALAAAALVALGMTRRKAADRA
jgi:hypothetical protein